MIRSIRKNVSFGLINKVFVVVVVLAIAGVFSLPMAFKNLSNQPWAIKVNGTPIARTTFLLTVEEQRERLAYMRTHYGQYMDMLQMMGMNFNPETLAIDQLAQQSLLQQLANNMHLIVDPQYVLEKMQDQAFAQKYLSDVMPAFLFDAAGNISQDRLKLYLQRKNMTGDKLTEEAGVAIQRSIAASAIRLLSYTPSFDLELSYQAQNFRKKFTLATFSYQHYLQKAKSLDITDDVLQLFFDEQNKTYNRYYTPEQRVGKVWKFTDKSYNISIPQKEIEDYYEKNKNTRYVLEPAKSEVRIITYLDETSSAERKPLYLIKQELQEHPARFAEYAKKYSDDDKSSGKGGLLVPLVRGSVTDKALEKAAFTLQNEGDISDVFPVAGGQAIIQLVKKQPRVYAPLSDVAHKIKQKLQKKAFKKQFSTDVRQLQNADQDQFDVFCKKHGATLERIRIDQSDTEGDDLSKKILFSIKTEGSFDSYTQGLTGSIVVLDTIIKKRNKTFEEVRDQVKKDYIEVQAEELLEADLTRARTELQTNPIATIAQHYGLSLETTDWIRLSDQQETRLLQKRGLPTNQMFQVEKKGSVLSHRSKKDGYLIILVDIEKPDVIDVAKMRDFKEKQTQEVENRIFESVIASLYRDATIEINETPEILNENYYL